MTCSVTGTGGRGLDTESIIVTISTRIRAGGDVDWVMPLFSAFLFEVAPGLHMMAGATPIGMILKFSYNNKSFV